MIDIHGEDNYFSSNPIVSKWCIIDDLASQYNTSLNEFIGKYSNINLSEDNMLGVYYKINLKMKFNNITRTIYSE